MECPNCHRQVPDAARFCPFCSANLSAQSEPTARLTPVQPTPPVPTAAPPPQPAPTPAAVAPAPAAVEPQPKTKPAAPWMLACGISCAAVLLLAVIGVGIYFGLPALRNSGATTTSGQTQQGTTAGTTQATTPVTGTPSAPPAAELAGEWDIVYWGGEGDWPTAVSLRQEGSSVVGEIIGRYETGIELTRAGSVRWTGTYKDANMPDGVPVTVTLPGADRIRVVDESIPGLDTVILIADRSGGSDFGPHPRADTEDEAIEAVSAEPKVAAWLREIEQAKAQGRKTSARFELEENFDDYCVVHVFEMVEDDGGGGHTATFGRYFVWKGSGLVVFLP